MWTSYSMPEFGAGTRPAFCDGLAELSRRSLESYAARAGQLLAGSLTLTKLGWLMNIATDLKFVLSESSPG